MKSLIAFIFSAFLTCACFAQQIAVPMKLFFANKESKYYGSVMKPSEKIEDLSAFSNIPAQPEAKAVYSVTAYSDDKSKEVFYVYVGLDKERGEKYIIVDSNGNLDFGDDEKYTFKLDVYDKYTDRRETMDLSIFVPLSVRIDRTGSEAEYKNSYVQINPYQTYDSHPDKDGEMLDFLATTCYFYRDTIKIDGRDVTITAVNSKINIIPDDLLNPDACFTLFTDVWDRKGYFVGDTLIIADKKLYLRKLEDNILYMDDLGHYADSSRVGSYLPALFARDLNNNELKLLNRVFEDKFVLIDFWGSWCGPCIAALPKMVELNDEIKDRDDVVIIGIASEYAESGVAKLKEIIKDKGVTWANYWLLRSNENSLGSPTGKLDIHSFPYYIITDKSGKIVFSSYDQAFLKEDAVDFFRNLINDK